MVAAAGAGVAHGVAAVVLVTGYLLSQEEAQQKKNDFHSVIAMACAWYADICNHNQQQQQQQQQRATTSSRAI